MIVRVWGKADNFELEFRYAAHLKKWCAAVPRDVEDGQYVVEIFAVNNYGETAYRTGILYMNGGACVIRLHSPNYTLWRRPQKFDLILRRWCKCG